MLNSEVLQSVTVNWYISSSRMPDNAATQIASASSCLALPVNRVSISASVNARLLRSPFLPDAFARDCPDQGFPSIPARFINHLQYAERAEMCAFDVRSSISLCDCGRGDCGCSSAHARTSRLRTVLLCHAVRPGQQLGGTGGDRMRRSNGIDSTTHRATGAYATDQRERNDEGAHQQLGHPAQAGIVTM
jgi:hypothetical protein